MKKNYIVLILIATLALTACGADKVSSQSTSAESTASDAQSVTPSSSEADDAIAEAVAMEQSSKEAEDAVDKAIADEESTSLSDSSDATEASDAETPEEKTITAEIGNRVPDFYITPFDGEKGTVETFSYMTYDYISDGEPVEKKANIYLPANYDPNGHYNVLYLLHGIGGSEDEWGLTDSNPRSKKILDNLIGNGDVEPFIVVTPNGRALACKHTDDTDSFYQFGLELRNDLIPYVESHYATYAEYNEDGYDLSATRTHRAIAGLSMGGMQTINIGICECMDLFSYFGAFSAAPTSYNQTKVASCIDASEYTIDYFYNICGTEDTIAYNSASAAAKNICTFTDRLVDGENFTWHEKNGGHDFNIWYLGLYNFSQIAFK